jgi:hypothetical protein
MYDRHKSSAIIDVHHRQVRTQSVHPIQQGNLDRLELFTTAANRKGPIVERGYTDE